MEMFSVLDTTSKDAQWFLDQDLRLVTAENLDEALEFISSRDLLAFDIETTGLSHLYDKLAGFSFSDGLTSYYAPVLHRLDTNLPKELYRELLITLSSKELIGHNFKFDWKMIKALEDIDMNITHDTYAMAALIDSDKIARKGALRLSTIAKELLGVEMLELKDDLQTTDFSTVTLDDAIYYAAPDALCTYQIYEILIEDIHRLELEDVYQLEIDIIKDIGTIELNGIKIDLEFIRKNTAKLESLVSSLKSDIEVNYGDNEYDINSPQQLAGLIYDKLRITPINENRSTDVRVLEMLKDRHEVIEKLMTYSSLSTLLSSFFSKIESSIAEDGRLHSDFHQFGARSGRFSSSGGIGKHGSSISINLQNMPRSHEGFNIRDAFVPREGYYWLHADYSQLEYRTMASLSGEDSLIDSYFRGVDFHKHTASLFLNIPLENVTDANRSEGKTLNFAVSYGMSKYGLANKLKISPDKAERMIADYFSVLPKLKALIRNVKEQAIKDKFVKTHFGRIRWFRDLPQERNALINELRKTFNTRIQGTAADLAKIGIRNTFRKLREHPELDISCVSTIHDELNFEVHKSIPPSVASRFIRDGMSLTLRDSKVRWTPIPATVSIGPTFGTQYELDDYGEHLYSEENDTLLYDEYLKKFFGEESVKEESKSSRQFKIEKPALIIRGLFSSKKLEKISELISKNKGNYNVYLVSGLDILLLNEVYRVNPTPLVLNSVTDLGFETETAIDASDIEIDIDALLGD